MPSLAVAGVRLTSVEALVVDGDMPASLLGMSYLGRLSGFEARPEGGGKRNGEEPPAF